VVFANLIASQGLLDSFVGSKVNGVCRTWSGISIHESANPVDSLELPAPNATLDIPRHKLDIPSLEIIPIPRCIIPEWVPTAAGLELNICIRVYRAINMCSPVVNLFFL